MAKNFSITHAVSQHKKRISCFKSHYNKLLNNIMFNNNLVLFKLTLITKDILLDVYESNPDFIYLFPHIVDNNSFSSHLTSMIIILNFK